MVYKNELLLLSRYVFQLFSCNVHVLLVFIICTVLSGIEVTSDFLVL